MRNKGQRNKGQRNKGQRKKRQRKKRQRKKGQHMLPRNFGQDFILSSINAEFSFTFVSCNKFNIFVHFGHIEHTNTNSVQPMISNTVAQHLGPLISGYPAYLHNKGMNSLTIAS